MARTPDPHPVLALQRSAGNHAVNALIARRRGPLGVDDELAPEADAIGGAAAQLPAVQAQAGLAAEAYARGDNLHFAPGHFDPEEELLGHELAHVRQQRMGRLP